ncbi:hypothetical protein G4B88_002353 (mitochondrion) [Cannabis sativa]|uniref:Uncharacterized protein n=1 Tax=Cannabis sativa TaxID=3483 RepID=A0A7J6DV12_CANSA|nr:hypothetical protein G4B88_002353 [Cannabis sativa]
MTEWYEQIKVIGFGSSPLTSLFTPLHMFLNGCAPPPRWAGAGLPPSYAAFISLAELGGSCNKPLSTLPFSYVFMKASRLSRSGPSSTTQSDLLCQLAAALFGRRGSERDRGFHGSSSSSSTLGARGLYLSKGEAAIKGRSTSCTFTCEALRSCLRKTEPKKGWDRHSHLSLTPQLKLRILIQIQLRTY